VKRGAVASHQYRASDKELQEYSEKGLEQNPLGKNPGDVFKIPIRPFPKAHFAVFPEKLCEKPIKAGCPEGGTVLDPFCGAGTVGVVAKKLQRKFIGIDIKKEYVDMSEKRIKNTQVQLELLK